MGMKQSGEQQLSLFACKKRLFKISVQYFSNTFLKFSNLLWQSGAWALFRYRMRSICGTK